MKHLWIHIGVLAIIVGLLFAVFSEHAEAKAKGDECSAQEKSWVGHYCYVEKPDLSNLTPERTQFMCAVGTLEGEACDEYTKIEPVKHDLGTPLEVKRAPEPTEEEKKIAMLRELIKQLRALLDELKAQQR